MRVTPFQMKLSAMLVAAPRYVGLMLFLTGFEFPGWALDSLHVAEAVAGLALAVLEGFAVSHIFSNLQRQAAPVVQWIAGSIGAGLLVLLPVCAAPYLMELFRGGRWFIATAPEWLQVAWVLAVGAMPILIIAGVSLVDQQPAGSQTLSNPASHPASLPVSSQPTGSHPAKPSATLAASSQTVHRCVCGKEFGSIPALNGHKRHCK